MLRLPRCRALRCAAALRARRSLRQLRGAHLPHLQGGRQHAAPLLCLTTTSININTTARSTRALQRSNRRGAGWGSPSASTRSLQRSARGDPSHPEALRNRGPARWGGVRTSSPRSSDRIHRCASGLGGASCAASRNFFSHPLAMLKRSVTALTMSRPLLAAAGSHVESPPRSLRRTPASPPRAAEALVSGSRHAGWRKTGFFSPALALCCEDLKSRGGFAVRPSSDELSARQARTQARELDTEKRIRFPCIAGGT